MEKERAQESVGRFAHGRSRLLAERGFSPISITAAVAVIALAAALLWRAGQSSPAPAPYAAPATSTASASAPLAPIQIQTDNFATTTLGASSSQPLSALDTEVSNKMLDAYAALKQAGIYSTSTAQAAGKTLVPLLNAKLSYPTFSSSDIKTDTDTSYKRMLAYRTDLRTALQPLLRDTRPAYEMLGLYVETKDTKYLDEMRAAAAAYREAASSTAQVIVPQDAVPYHVAILNAMEEFAATLDAIAAQANDPLAVTGLLQNYNQAESDMLTSFNALTTYYKSKTP